MVGVNPSRGPIIAAIGAVGAITLLFLAAYDASGHGTLDQTFTGNPDCSFDNFKGSWAGGALQQEVVPTLGGLIAVDVCVNGEMDTAFTVNIRAGSLDAPGEVLATMTAQIGGSYEFVHVDLPETIAVTPGQKFMIELPNTDAVAWVSTCNEIIGTCDHVDTDMYPAGMGTHGPIRDFVFRTYGGDAPTPSPTPVGTTRIWGDTDCGGLFNIGDAINIARKLVNLAVNQAAGCPALAATVTVSGSQQMWVDTDCGGLFNIGDAINIARKLINLAVNQSAGCPALGANVQVSP